LRTDIQERDNHLIRVDGIELYGGDVLVFDRRLESAYIHGIKDIGAVAFGKSVDVYLAVGGDGHVLVVFAECAFAGGVDDVGEDDAFETVGAPDEDLSADKYHQLTVGTGL
jgi:hypothetical protein